MLAGKVLAISCLMVMHAGVKGFKLSKGFKLNLNPWLARRLHT